MNWNVNLRTYAFALVLLLACAQSANSESGFFSEQQSNCSVFKFEQEYNDRPQASLLTPRKRDLLVKSSVAEIRIRKGAVVCAVDFGSKLLLYNLHSTVGGVKVEIPDGELISVLPGQELMLTNSVKGFFEELHPITNISYRNPTEIKVGKTLRGFLADFSVQSAMLEMPPLTALLHSSNPQDRKTARSVLKSAVILYQVTAYKGPYSDKQ